MGSIGDCYGNAVIESFWGRMQTELINPTRGLESSIPTPRNRGNIKVSTKPGAVHDQRYAERSSDRGTRDRADIVLCEIGGNDVVIR